MFQNAKYNGYLHNESQDLGNKKSHAWRGLLRKQESVGLVGAFCSENGWYSSKQNLYIIHNALLANITFVQF